jgi:tetratricopeptide (TPR) repeat protein
MDLQRIGPYRVVDTLGAGGMGVVYLVEDPRLQRRAAVKLLPAHLTSDSERTRRFEHEARIASSLNHPNIITIYDIGQSDAGQYIAMELVVGQTLRALCQGPAAYRDVLEWSSQMARALAVAHDAGIVHRDLKPENVMVRGDGFVKLLDFGLAQLDAVQPDAATGFATAPGSVLGTLRYMSPEQTRGERVGPATDLFSLGLVMYELATGCHPFQAATLPATVVALVHADPAPPSSVRTGLPAGFDHLVLGLLAKDSRHRPPAAAVVAALADLGRVSHAESPVAPADGSLVLGDATAAPVFIGRVREREAMARAFESACQGRGRLLAVAGEAGIGKTSLVDAFLADQARASSFSVAHGRCSERVAGTEAYLPWLEALEALRRGGRAALIKRLAPAWHAQLAPLDDEHASDVLIAASLRTASQERLKRELAALLEAAALEQPLVVVIEDLHWADVSTVDLLAFVGSRLATMAVLVVTTYRHSELALAKSPFIAIRQDLQARGVASELRLDFLDQGDIEAYLEAEFPGHTLPSDFATMVRARTEGSPLFMVDLLRYLRDRGAIARIDGRWTLTDAVAAISRDLPESMRGMIDRKLGQLAEGDRGLLVAAAVQGYQFDTAVVAEVIGLDQSAVEERLETLDATFGLVRFSGELGHPNGTLSLAYRFVHILYQEALYNSLKPTRRVALSKATASALMRAHGDQIDRVAVQLAALHEAARDYAAAAECHLRAARNATRVFASHESVALARNGLRMAALLPPTPAKDRLELQLSLTLGWSLINVRGYSGVEVEQTYTHAAALAEGAEGQADLYRALWGLAMCYLSRAEYGRVFTLAERILGLARDAGQPPALTTAHYMLGTVSVYLGDLVAARQHYADGIALGDAHPGASDLPDGRDPAITCRAQLGRVLWLLGYPDQAVAVSDAAVTLATRSGQPHSIVFALWTDMFLRHFQGDLAAVADRADRILMLAREHDLPQYRTWAGIVRGWALAMQGDPEGVTAMQQNLAVYDRIGSALSRTHFLGMLAQALGTHSQVNEALAVVNDAFADVERYDERYFEAALHRIRGELLLQLPGASPADAESAFAASIACAQRQHSKAFELSAATSLARLWRDRRRAAAVAILGAAYSWFTEGHDTADLRAARQLLAEMS